jgi:outer membrane lipoprotein-sorting protein
MFDVRRKFALLCLGFMVSLPMGAQTAAPAANADVQKVISQLNAAAAKFVSAQANFTWDQLVAAVQDHEIQTGTIYFERKKDVTRMAAHLEKENGKEAPKTVVYDSGEVKYYVPAIKQLTIMKAGANRGQWESFLTLGMGGSGDDLETNWQVSLLGTENINGVSVAKLDLVPKDQKVRDMFTHVTIWVDPVQSVSYKQVFYESGGDSRTATYSNIRYNKPIPGEVFEIKPPPGTTRVEK